MTTTTATTSAMVFFFSIDPIGFFFSHRFFFPRPRPLSKKTHTFQQRYGYKNSAVDAKEKAKLQAEILDLLFSHGEFSFSFSFSSSRCFLLSFFFFSFLVHRRRPSSPSHETSSSSFLFTTTTTATTIKKKKNKKNTHSDASPLYEITCADLGWQPDATKLASMRAANDARVKELDAAIDDAKENAGDVEVRDAELARANYLCDIGDRARAARAFEEASSKTAGAGPKLDAALSLIRLDMALGDWRSVRAGLEKAEKLCEQGGDWERKNRIRVYRAAAALARRDLPAAAALLVDAVSTFSTTELFPYERVVFYAAVAGAATLPRPDLKSKIVDSPEVLALTRKDRALASFLEDLHGCRYAPWLAALSRVARRVAADRLLGPHARHWTREMRRVAYSQFLESYKSVTLDAMASAFGVRAEFLDEELADLVASGAVAARVDAVGRVVTTARAEPKLAAYRELLKAGDALLNRLQRLAKVADAE